MNSCTDIPSPRNLAIRSRLLQAIREFFQAAGFLEVETPVRIPTPAPELHIDAPASGSYWLRTSPELHMKRLLAAGSDRIFQIGPCFREKEIGRLHREEFTMLEWYRTGTDYRGIMEETEQLVRQLAETLGPRCTALSFPFARMTVAELYENHAGWNPAASWDEDRYFRDWAEKIEPALAGLGAFFLMDFPAPLAALAQIGRDDPLICERFELFINGLEIGNAYSELLDYDEHVRRFEHAHASRTAMGKQPYPADIGFMEALRLGLPACGGIAVGIDRLIMALLGLDTIGQVQAFPAERL